MFSCCDGMVIEHVFFKPDSFANIYVVTTENGICVTLLDSTPEVKRIEAMQQTGNELNLCKERLKQAEKKLKQALKS